MLFARKMPEFYIMIARKIFFPNFLGVGRGHVPPCPRLLRLWAWVAVPIRKQIDKSHTVSINVVTGFLLQTNNELVDLTSLQDVYASDCQLAVCPQLVCEISVFKTVICLL